MKETETDSRSVREYSIAEIVEEAKAYQASGRKGAWDHSGYGHSRGGSFTGATWGEAINMASEGWEEGVTEARKIVESVIPLIETELPQPMFQTHFDVSGCEVDMDRFLTGIPENMIQYENVVISKAGRLITLVVSTCVSGAMSSKTIQQRGVAIVALTLALQRCQHEVEIWADFTTGDQPFSKGSKLYGELYGTDRAKYCISTRVLVKSAHDSIDDSVLAYWLGHESSSRMFGFLGHGLRPKALAKVSSSLGLVHDAVSDGYPEHALMLESMISYDIQNADQFVLKQLRDLGIIEQTREETE